MKNLKIYILCCLLPFTACQDDEPAVIQTDLQPYIDNFVAEAATRGVTIDIEEYDLSGYIGEIDVNNVVGQCRTYSNDTREIVIATDYWRTASELQREKVIFHELGHCILGRDHDDSANANGTCVTMMNTGEGHCRFIYNQNTRTAYLGELFNF